MSTQSLGLVYLHANWSAAVLLQFFKIIITTFYNSGMVFNITKVVFSFRTIVTILWQYVYSNYYSENVLSCMVFLNPATIKTILPK